MFKKGDQNGEQCELCKCENRTIHDANIIVGFGAAIESRSVTSPALSDGPSYGFWVQTKNASSASSSSRAVLSDLSP